MLSTVRLILSRDSFQAVVLAKSCGGEQWLHTHHTMWCTALNMAPAASLLQGCRDTPRRGVNAREQLAVFYLIGTHRQTSDRHGHLIYHLKLERCTLTNHFTYNMKSDSTYF